MINVNDIIKLSDDKEYLVVSSVNYKDVIYLYLIEVVNNGNIKFVELYDNQVIEITDNELLDELIELIILEERLSF